MQLIPLFISWEIKRGTYNPLDYDVAKRAAVDEGKEVWEEVEVEEMPPVVVQLQRSFSLQRISPLTQPS